MIIGVCQIELDLAGLSSLKQKRRVVKPLLARLHKQFNVSAAEIDRQDVWQSAVIVVAVVTNSTAHAHQVLDNILSWVELNQPNVYIVRASREIL